MAFSNDSGGFAFACEDAKLSISTGTWNKRLSQIARVVGPVLIMTGALRDPDYISRTLGKRPRDIFIIANASAHKEARVLKLRFPDVRIALHHDHNAKVVLVWPDIIWLSSGDFGKTMQLESVVGLRSVEVFRKTRESFFDKLWAEATEIV